MLITMAAAAVFLSLAMAGAWLVQRRTGNSGWIDTIWSLATAAAGAGAALGAAVGAGWGGRPLLVAALVAVWGARLGGHIAARSRGAPEDPRYAQLIEAWGAEAGRRLFLFLQVQAVAGLTLVALAARNPAPLWRAVDVFATALFLAALVGAAVADDQLRRFQADPANRGGVCDRGLWAYSRHPNYFFEWLGWCAYPLLALSAAAPWGALALGAPLLMYVLLAHVSGVPPLEAHMERSRGEAFARYRARVNAFFPGPRRDPHAVARKETP
ncbi:MAG TPA: DUF1295 domain-containing protein [Beijerinckiaceae bacterium]